mgnify:CR=1 FL=1
MLHFRSANVRSVNPQRAVLEALEIALMQRLGIADPYQPRPYTTRRKKA